MAFRVVQPASSFLGEEPAALAHAPARGRPPWVRNKYLCAWNSAVFIEGRDFVTDYAAGTLRRTPGSRLPDFRNNLLFGQEDFNIRNSRTVSL